MLQGVTTCKVGVRGVVGHEDGPGTEGDAEDEHQERWDFEGHWNSVRKLSWGLTYVFCP